jgi:hypothetical protein
VGDLKTTPNISDAFRTKHDMKPPFLLIIVNYNELEDKYLYKKFASTTLFCKFAMKDKFDIF